jgi:hypothetical protein
MQHGVALIDSKNKRILFLIPPVILLSFIMASGRSCDQPTGLFLVFLGPRANAEFLSQFQVALHARSANIKISP